MLNISGSKTVLTIKEIKAYIKPLLFKSEQWFKRELQLYNNFLALFDYSENQILYKKVMKKLAKQDVSTMSKEYRVHLALNYGIQLINENHWESAKKVLLEGKRDAKRKNLLFQELLIDCLVLNQTKQVDYLFNKLIDLGYQNKLTILKRHLRQ